MKLIKILGIFSSTILILNYLIVGPMLELGAHNAMMYKYFGLHHSIIFTLSLLGFNLALLLEIKRLDLATLIATQALIVGLCGFNFIIGILGILSFDIPYFLSSGAGFITLVLTIIWAIKLFRIKDRALKRVKKYALALIITHGVVFISILLNFLLIEWMFRRNMQPFEYMNLVFALYGVSYIFGLILFIKQLAVNNPSSS